MAEDGKAKDKGAAPAADAAAAAVPAKKLLGGKNLLVMIVMILVLGGGAGFWIHHTKQKHAAEEAGAEPPPPEETSSIEAFNPVVVNVMGTQGTRYLKVSVSVELSSTSLKEYLAEYEERKVELTDRLVTVLGSKSLDQLDSPDERNDLKRQLRDEVQTILSKKSGSIKNVYFTEFVVQ